MIVLFAKCAIVGLLMVTVAVNRSNWSEMAFPPTVHSDGTSLSMSSNFGTSACRLYMCPHLVESTNGIGHRTTDYIAGMLMALRYGATFVHQDMPTKGNAHGEVGGEPNTFFGFGEHDPHLSALVASGSRVVPATDMAYGLRRSDRHYGYQMSDKWLAEWLAAGHFRCGDILMTGRDHNDDVGPLRWLLARRYQSRTEKLGRRRPLALLAHPCACHVSLHYRLGDRPEAVAMSAGYAFHVLAGLADLARAFVPRLAVVVHVLTDGQTPYAWLGSVRALFNESDDLVHVHSHMEMTTLETIHFFTESDVLVLSKSSLSYVAALFSTRPVVLAPPPLDPSSYPFRYCAPGTGFVCMSSNGTTATPEDATALAFHMTRIRAVKNSKLLACD